ALWTAVNQRPKFSFALPGGGVENIRVRRVHSHIRNARVLADRENLGPSFPAVARLVESAVSAAIPQRPLRGDVNCVRILWVDDDFADVLRILQAHVR